MNDEIKVGYISKNYPESRCIIGKGKNCQYIYCDKKKNIKFIIKKCLTKIRLINHWDAISTYTINNKRIDIFNTINTILKTKNKWCVIFESTVPRNSFTVERNWENSENIKIDKKTLKQISYLAKDNCKAIISMSNNAMEIQKNMLNKLNVEEQTLNKIIKKMSVLLPPQNLLTTINEIENKYEKIEKINFIFVGKDFFRKGGAQVIDALKQLENKYNFNLTIISKLNYGDYASHTNEEEQKKYKEIIKNTKWINYYETLPNQEVLELMKKSHIGLLPTFADTFGFSLLEMQAAGLPVISTNVRALEEVNNKECGYIINLNKNQQGEAKYHNYNDFIENRKKLRDGLIEAFQKIFEDKEKNLLLEKAKKSYERIVKNHNPEEYAQKIYEIYNN